MELSLPVFMTWVCRGRDLKHPTYRLRGQRSNRLRYHRGGYKLRQQSKRSTSQLCLSNLPYFLRIIKNSAILQRKTIDIERMQNAQAFIPGHRLLN